MQVSELAPGELELVELYLAWRVPQHVAAALRRVWQSHPNALRVKELFETLETYALIERQLSIIGARCTKQGRPSEALQHVFDLACGHGLLGVLLARRFPALRVVCVDLERCSCLSLKLLKYWGPRTVYPHIGAKLQDSVASEDLSVAFQRVAARARGFNV